MEQKWDKLQRRLSAASHMLPLYLGGSFNPFHCGHMAMVESLRRELPQCPVILLPNRISPLKIEQPDNLSTPQRWPSEQQKIGLLEAALLDLKEQLTLDGIEPNVSLEFCELYREGPSYTVDTLRYLLGATSRMKPIPGPQGPKRCLFSLGWDSFCELHLWKDWPYLLENCILLVFRRAFLESEKQVALPHKIVTQADYALLELDIPCSSTEARKSLGRAAGQELARQPQLEKLLGPRQLAYILEQGLYEWD